MKILIKHNPCIIALTGDRCREAFANYMFAKHNKVILDTNFAVNFCNKYNAKVVLLQQNGISFYFLKF